MGEIEAAESWDLGDGGRDGAGELAVVDVEVGNLQFAERFRDVAGELRVGDVDELKLGKPADGGRNLAVEAREALESNGVDFGEVADLGRDGAIDILVVADGDNDDVLGLNVVAANAGPGGAAVGGGVPGGEGRWVA